MAKKINDSDISRAAQRLVDASFFVGDSSLGWDCYSSLKHFYAEIGISIPTELDGWTVDNYGERWKKDQEEGRKILTKLLFGLGRKIDVNYMQRGDLLIFEGTKIPTFPGIFLGNGNCLMVFDIGAKVVPLKFFKSFLIQARRLID